MVVILTEINSHGSMYLAKKFARQAGRESLVLRNAVPPNSSRSSRCSSRGHRGFKRRCSAAPSARRVTRARAPLALAALDPLDACPQAAQPLIDALVAAIDLLRVVDGALTLGDQGGEQRAIPARMSGLETACP